MRRLALVLILAQQALPVQAASSSCAEALDALVKAKTSPARIEAPVRERLSSQMRKTAENILGADAKPAAERPLALSGTGILAQRFTSAGATITLYFDRHGLLKAYRMNSGGAVRENCIGARK